MAGGYEYINVMTKYQEAYDQDRTDERNAILRWLHGDYATRTEARQSIEVRTIIDDRNVYDHIRLLAAFVKCAGYQGMLVTLDEMATLSKLTSTQARRSNLDQILYMLNDIYQGSTRHLGFILAGTPSSSPTNEGVSTATRPWLPGCRRTRTRPAIWSTWNNPSSGWGT